MQLGLAISIILHLGILAWAFVTIQSTPELKAPEVVPISVAIVTPSELTRMKEGDENAKELEAKAKEKPSPDTSKNDTKKPQQSAAPPPPPPPAAEPPPPPPEPVKAEPPKPEPPKPDPIAEKMAALAKEPPPPPEPAPGPTPEEQKALEDKLAAEQRKAEEQKKLEEQRKAEEKRKADEKRKALEKARADAKAKALAKAKAEAKAKEDAKTKELNLEQLAQAIAKAPDDGPQKALIDKDPTKKGQQAAGTSQDTKHTGRTAGTADGKDSVLSAREADLLKGQLNAQLKQCWRLPGGGGGPETPVVRLAWRMRPDGSLDGEPRVLQPQNSPAFQVAAEAALRAVRTCAPFRLPPDKYAAWGNITDWEFDPRQMF